MLNLQEKGNSVLNKVLGKHNYLGFKGNLSILLGSSPQEVILKDADFFNGVVDLVSKVYKPHLEELLGGMEVYFDVINSQGEVSDEDFDRSLLALNRMGDSVEKINYILDCGVENAHLIALADLEKDFLDRLDVVFVDSYERYRDILEVDFIGEKDSILTEDQHEKNDEIFMEKLFANLDILVERLSFLIENSYETINNYKSDNRAFQLKMDKLAIELNNNLIIMQKIVDVAEGIFTVQE
ncbi:MAG: hypothetical protein V3575_03660 [Candidatus Absconditabacteria bacterium]